MSRTYALHTPTAGAPERAALEIDFQKELNPQQHAAVTSPPGQSLVIAGAGSGKTRTLTYRVAYLIANDIAPENILLLTFTNKAAREMLERVNHLVPGRAAGIWGGTFHSIGNRILRRHAEQLGYARNFSILDSDDQKSLLQKIVDGVAAAHEGSSGPAVAKKQGRAKKNEGFPKAQVVGGLISFATNTCQSLDDVIDSRYPYFDEIREPLKQIARAYGKKKKESNSLDFDDLLAQTVSLLREREGTRRHYQRQFQFILVDEYQDTNALQSEMIEMLAGPEGNVMVVGDDAQSIYSWRGANFENIIDFPNRYPKAHVHKIETNYRSVPEVLNLANQAIAANVRQFPKTLQPARPEAGSRPALVELSTPSMQAAFVSQRLRELHEQEGIDWKDMAILYRAHHLSMEVQMQLTQDRIPFVITSGLRFFEQAHVKDVVSFLKWAANPHDEVSFDRMVRLLNGLGPGAAGKLWLQWLPHAPAAALPSAEAETGEPAGIVVTIYRPPASFSAILRHFDKVPSKAQGAWDQLGHLLDEFLDPGSETGFHTPSEMIRSVVEGLYDDHLRQNFDNARDRRQDIDQLMMFAERYTTLDDMLAELALLTNADDSSPKDGRPPKRGDDAVALTSVHQAKGLEWKVVFLIWLTDGMFPNKRAIDEGGGDTLEEERRLFYVAVTRAMDQLYLSFPTFWPKAYSGDTYQEPSRFLHEVGPELVEEWKIHGY